MYKVNGMGVACDSISMKLLLKKECYMELATFQKICLSYITYNIELKKHKTKLKQMAASSEINIEGQCGHGDTLTWCLRILYYVFALLSLQ